ncbi:LOW QUALITY PROTEIN: uncharacterized protein si:ch73-100l22.3 [Gadus macrocephalus]|uniref:LOW QUALITY PROTEIN: uncharacterized protein si:ch73-100l22.3 n=1 Tax=Gadus macrocephalus TaxID=80720 RepID=UPI0028CB8DDD|nr:LOW QUALITY PROTEIN: uncharacterized protein si:ch73-100l22.3 [Gadus macrocephalus]
MEDYEEFAANRLSELRSPADPPSGPGRLCGHRSLIRFHGRCVLPPLLSGERREEMRTLKEHLKKPSDRSESAASGLVDRVRHILHSVQLRKAPTLQEFFEEKSGLPPLSPPSSPHREASPPPAGPQQGAVGPEGPPLTSTTYSGMSRRPPPPHSQPLLDPPGDVSRRSQSSGDGTHNVMGRADWARESRVEGGTSLGGFLLCSPSNRTAMTPDIISHPPIDGEKLERSAMDTSIEDCLIANDMLTEVCSAEPDHKQSVIGSLSAESGPPVGHLVTCVPLGTAQETNHGVRPPQGDSSGRRDTGCGQEGPRPTVEAGPEVTLSPATTPPPQVLGESSRPPGEPYRLSLQALLKKSQECRQQQRALRNQARPGRVVPEREGTEESLSDKENQEVPHKAPQRRSTKHTSGDTPADTALNKWGKDEQEGSRVEDLALKGSTDEFTTSHNTKGFSSTGSANSETLDLGGKNKTIPENIPPALSPGGAHEAASNPGEALLCPLRGQPPPPGLEVRSGGVSDPQRGGGYHVLPSPVLCTSPVHCKSRGLHEGGHAHPETGAHNGHSQGQPGAQPVQGGGPAGLALSRSSAHTQQMDQLELNLSGLKLLISELESTITENMRNQAPPGDPPHGGHSLSGEGRPVRDSAWTGGPTDEDTDPELWDFIDLPYFRPHRGGDSGAGSHGSPGQAPARGLARGSAAGGGGGGSPSAQGAPGARGPLTCSRIPQPSAKRPSVSPRPLIPDAFWEIQPVRVQSDSSNQPFRVQSDSSNQPFRVQSDSSNQPFRGRPPAAVAEGDPLNRSYDVERPSGLWRLDPSGSGAGSYLSPVPDHKRRTPESEGGAGGQGGVSKAKRRLLMHAEQAAEERRRGRLSYASPPNAPPPGRGAGGDPGDELQQAHAAQWRALQAEQGVQQQHLLQALSERCRLLQRVSSLCPPSVSWPGDAATLSGGGVLSDVCFQLPLPAAPPLQSVGRSLPERWRPLVAAAVKGFLTRRLLRTGRVQQLRRTARDTQQFLQAFENQSPGGREGLCSRQDGLLWERVTLQLRSVRYEIHDVFFRLTAAEKMQLIRWDRELKQQTGPPGRVVGKSSLSAATQKSLERKRRIMMQQMVPDRPWVRGAQGPHLRGPPTPQRRPGQLRTSRPQRGPKTSRTGRR